MAFNYPDTMVGGITQVGIWWTIAIVLGFGLILCVIISIIANLKEIKEQQVKPFKEYDYG
jgi:hypothetical protein